MLCSTFFSQRLPGRRKETANFPLPPTLGGGISPSRGLLSRAPNPARRYLGRGRAGESFHADCRAALLFWAGGWWGPGR